MTRRLPTAKLIGRRLKRARKLAGFRSREAAGVRLRPPKTRETIRWWEEGKSVPDALQIAQLARIYQVPALYPLGLTQAPTVEIAAGSPRAARIMELADEILLLASEERALKSPKDPSAPAPEPPEAAGAEG